MSIFPTLQVVTGTGKPRFIKEMVRNKKYSIGTASQSSNIITGSGTNWNNSMVDGKFTFANGVERTIEVVNSQTSITVSETGTVTSQGYAITYFGAEYYRTAGVPTYLEKYVQEYQNQEYNTGEASQSGTTITGVGTNWNESMIGGTITFADETERTILDVTDETHLMVAESGTVGQQGYEIIYTSLDPRVQIGRRISSLQTIEGFESLRCYGKIISLDTTNHRIYVDEWIGGVPSDGGKYIIDGWIADLPRCEELKESFEPDVLIHNVWNKKKQTKMYGYEYEASLQYEAFTSPDMLFDLKEIVYVIENSGDETIVFIPRNDKPGMSYNVYFSQSMSFILHPSQKGYHGLTIGVKGKELIALPWHFAFGGYGTGYGQSYGQQL